MKPFDAAMAESARSQFPALARQHKGQSLIYFDGPAGTQVPQPVIDAISHYLSHHNANHAGTFITSRESDAMLNEALRAMADFLGANSPQEIVFGANMTTLTFAFSRALAKTWNKGDEIIVTATDHDANITPWVLAAEERGAVVKMVNFRSEDYCLDLDHFKSLLSPGTRLVAVGCASNATGTINPVAEITSLAHEVGALIFLDAVHFSPHGLIDVRQWDCDFLVCSAYKFFGPHLGVLWGRRQLLAELPTYKVRPSSDDLPWRWMTGTQNHEAIAGVLACVNYQAEIGRKLSGDASLARRAALVCAMQAIAVYESKLIWQLLDGLVKMDDVKVFGILDAGRARERFSTVSFTSSHLSSQDIALALADRGICVWHGHYYALEFAQRLKMGSDGMIRVGLLHYNTQQEVERFLRELQEILAAAT